jgi:uncharacterized protein YndB with AHSA1/START domain
MSTAVTSPSPAVTDLIVEIRQEIQVNASVETTFAALLEQLSSGFDKPDGTSMPLKLEARPGGRWYRDLGDDNGHYWGVVQAIKRPTLLEFCGPMSMSLPVAGNIQYRLSEKDGGTLIQFHHLALGLFSADHRQGLLRGWGHIHESARKRAERKH